MRSVIVAVEEVFLQHGLQIWAAKDQEVVEHLSASAANPALCE